MLVFTLLSAAWATSPCEPVDRAIGLSPISGSVVGNDAKIWTAWSASSCDGEDPLPTGFEVHLLHRESGRELRLTGAAEYPLDTIEPGPLEPGEWDLEFVAPDKEARTQFTVLEGPTPEVQPPAPDAVTLEWGYGDSGDGLRTGRLWVLIDDDGPGSMPLGSRWIAQTTDGERVHQGIQGLELSSLGSGRMPNSPFRLPTGDTPVCIRVTPINAAGVAGVASEPICTPKPESCGCASTPTVPAACALAVGLLTLWRRRRASGRTVSNQ